MGWAMGECVFKHDRTAKTQICTVWSGPTLSANRIIGYYRMYEWKAKAWMALCSCTRCSESMHFMHVRRHFFAWRPICLIYSHVAWSQLALSKALPTLTVPQRPVILNNIVRSFWNILSFLIKKSATFHALTNKYIITYTLLHIASDKLLASRQFFFFFSLH